MRPGYLNYQVLRPPAHASGKWEGQLGNGGLSALLLNHELQIASRLRNAVGSQEPGEWNALRAGSPLPSFPHASLPFACPELYP